MKIESEEHLTIKIILSRTMDESFYVEGLSKMIRKGLYLLRLSAIPQFIGNIVVWRLSKAFLNLILSTLLQRGVVPSPCLLRLTKDCGDYKDYKSQMSNHSCKV